MSLILVGTSLLNVGGGPLGTGSSATPQCATPTFSPIAGSYTGVQTVTISCATGGVAIHYTTDGTTPTGGSATYSGPITVSSSETVQAIAVLSGYTNSAVGSAAYTITSGATQVFNLSNFTGSSNVNTVSNGAISGGVLSLTSSSISHTVGMGWYRTAVNIQSFQTTFQFSINSSSFTIPQIAGMTFCIQNANEPAYGGNPLQASADANLAGYGCYDPAGPDGPGQQPINNSVAIKFDLNNNSGGDTIFPPGGSPNSTGLYINGGPFSTLIPHNDLNPYGISFYQAHTYTVNVVYDGSMLTMTLLDTNSNVSCRQSWPVNIPACVGASTAYIGFTGGDADSDIVGFNILNWQYSTGYNTRLASPTFSVTPGQYTSTQTVNLSGPSGASIYYTTNGLQPTAQSNLYSSAITVSSSAIINAVAIQSGYTDSNVAQGNYQIAANGTPIINFPTGFSSASNLMTLVGRSTYSGSTIKLVDTLVAQEGGAAWYSAPVNIQTFTSAFTWQVTSASGNGMCFVIQNQPPTSVSNSAYTVTGGPNALALANNGLGYGYAPANPPLNYSGGQYTGLLSSLGLIWSIYHNTFLFVLNGKYTLGDSASGTSITGINLTSGHSYSVALTYDGTSLVMTMTDTTTTAQFSQTYTGSIPTAVGANTAYVGFTAGTGGAEANIAVSSFTFT